VIIMSTLLSYFHTTKLFTRKVRIVISDYALAISIVIAILASYSKSVR
jgi:hypothetical protein